jgi:CRP/FNR family nitrogen fixation transcriptional regulator
MQVSRVTAQPSTPRSAAAFGNHPDPRVALGATHRAAPDAFALLEQFGCTVALRRGQQIYHHDQPTAFCWRILSGCARSVKLMEDGRRQVAAFLWLGDLLGMHDGDAYYADAEAVTDLVLRRYPRRVVEAQAAGNAALAASLRAIALANLRAAQKQIVLLGRKTALERIASFLLEIDRHAASVDRHLVELPMSRTDIADYLGLSIETVCRNLAQLQREGTVAILRAGIELRDRATLLELACE